MVSKSQIKLISSLQQKKGRLRSGLFAVEGIKGINDLLNSEIELFKLFTTQDIFSSPKEKTHFINEEELKRISNLITPQVAVGIFKIPQSIFKSSEEEFILALDGVRDPGNLGTIIRLCDWFGVETLVCSNDTVDCYNPKVVQATMGSIARVRIFYEDLPRFIDKINLPIIGSFLEGENIYRATLPLKGLLVMGNEANGISEQVENLIQLKLHIPQFGKIKQTESLNVAMATSIFLSEFKRSNFTGK